MAHLSLRDFKGAVRKGVAIPRAAVLHKTLSVSMEGAGQRRKRFTISTAAVDRDGDTIALGGWDLTGYLSNPVVLWGHESHAPPIGRSIEIGIEGGALKAVVEFVPADMPIIGEQSEMLFRLCDGGFLSACSVGFRPIEFVTAKERMTDDDWYPPVDFKKQELLEFSVVTIPSNPEAVLDEARTAPASPNRSQGTTEAMRARRAIAARRRQLRAACY